MNFLKKIKNQKSRGTGIGKLPGNSKLNMEQLAAILKTDPKALKEFEDFYRLNVLSIAPSGPFEKNSHEAALEKRGITETWEDKDGVVNRIVQELLNETISVYSFTGESSSLEFPFHEFLDSVRKEEVESIPAQYRPQLTGSMAVKDFCNDSCEQILWLLQKSRTEEDPKKRQFYYHQFRQGLDILDLDPVTYEMLGMNPNSMGNWLPKVVDANKWGTFFKIPKTKIVKVPMPILQMTRIQYETLTSTTLDIVNKWAMEAFGLQEDHDYFIKTGTYSSKFDFRNTLAHGAAEVRELGEYLLYIQGQASMMAGPLCTPPIYGVSTTNEWVVREFIHDKEANPVIYKGMPLHTEYRLFIDCDTDEVIGVSPYWEPKMMKQRFWHEPDADSPHNIHDYAIFLSHEDTLMRRYEANVGRVMSEAEKILPYIDLAGQWSIDIMQNGEDFWIIDMAWAQDSALKGCIPENKRRVMAENWIPKIPAMD